MCLLWILTLALMTQEFGTSSAATYSHEYGIAAYLFDNSGYRSYLRPVQNLDDTLNVNIQANVFKLSELDAVQQTFTIYAWLITSWKDLYLQWDPDQFGGTTKIVIPVEYVWLPDLIIRNSLGFTDVLLDNSGLAVIYSNGLVLVQGQKIISTLCYIEVENFPFDVQHCTIGINSRSYTNEELDVKTEPYVLDRVHEESQEFLIKNITSSHTTEFNRAYSNLHFTLKRYTGFYLWNLIGPFLGLLAFTAIQFLIPVNGGERMSFAITVLLAMTVFQLLLLEKLPQTSKVTPFATSAFTTLMGMAASTLLISLLVQFLHNNFTCEKTPLQYIRSFRIVRAVMGRYRTRPPTRVKVTPVDSVSYIETREDPRPDVTSAEDIETLWKTLAFRVNYVTCACYVLMVFLYVLIGYYTIDNSE